MAEAEQLGSPERQRKAKAFALQFVQEQLRRDSADTDEEVDEDEQEMPAKRRKVSPKQEGINKSVAISFPQLAMGLMSFDENANQIKQEPEDPEEPEDSKDNILASSDASQQSWTHESSQDSNNSDPAANFDPDKPVRKNGAKCPECGFVSPNRGELQKHMRKHTPDKPYGCPIPGCSFRTRYPNNIRHHLPSHLDDRPFPCGLCELKFKRKSQLTTHMLIHTQTKNFACDLCESRFKRRWELKMHKLSHSDKKYFKCEECGHETKTLSDLNKHKFKHRVSRDFVCDICSKAYKDNRALHKHMAYTHADNPPVCCEICQKEFKNKVYLKKHQLLHEGHYPYSCDICGMKFSSLGNRKNHMVVHSEEGRPYKCPVCPYSGKTELDVRAHIGVMHRKDRIYRCDVCLIGFAKEQGLRQHYNTSKHLKNLEKLVTVSEETGDIVVKIEREETPSPEKSGVVGPSTSAGAEMKLEARDEDEEELEQLWGQGGGDNEGAPIVKRLDSGVVVLQAQQAEPEPSEQAPLCVVPQVSILRPLPTVPTMSMVPPLPTVPSSSDTITPTAQAVINKVIQNITRRIEMENEQNKKKPSPKKPRLPKKQRKSTPKRKVMDAEDDDVADDVNNNVQMIKPIGTLIVGKQTAIIKREPEEEGSPLWTNDDSTSSLITAIKAEPSW